MRLRLGCDAQARQSQPTDCENRCGQTWKSFHSKDYYPSVLWLNKSAPVFRAESYLLIPSGCVLPGRPAHFWQVGHQKTFRPSSTVVRIGSPDTRQGSPARL